LPSWRAALLGIAIVLAGLALACCAAAPEAGQSATGGAATQVAVQPVDTTAMTAASATATPTVTNSPTPTTTPTASPTATATPSPTPSATPSPTPSATPSPTSTATPTPLPTPDGVPRQVRAPILMYHYLSDPPPGADRYRRDLSVSPALFEQHLAYLQAEGYQSITLYDLLYHLAQGVRLPERPVIITFDDGYRDNYTNAFPLLQQYGFDATFFVLVEVTNQGEAEYLTWDMMREMHAAGMDIECHARVHEYLTDNDDDRLTWQVLGCREALESELGQRPRFISYPSGRFDERVAAFFASDHYWGGVTTQQGTLHSSGALFQIKRLRVRNTTTVAELAELLAFEE
jgi:peptidoglycan/xylan/chitin deacetylase (PgdA/CDA1 family)